MIITSGPAKITPNHWIITPPCLDHYDPIYGSSPPNDKICDPSLNEIEAYIGGQPDSITDSVFSGVCYTKAVFLTSGMNSVSRKIKLINQY